MINFEAVGFRYPTGTQVFDGVNLSVPRGSFHFLVGPSGSGKSSLLRLMYLAARPTAGRVMLFGRDTAGLDRTELALLRRRIGVVFQDFRLIDHLNIVDNVALPLRIAGAPSGEIVEPVVALLRWVGLGGQLDARPATLSGGEQQRVAIARAVIARPDLLVADEPTGNVDDQIGWRLLRLFAELNRLGTTVVVATHNEAMIRRMDVPVIRLDSGRVTTRARVPAGGPAEV